MTESPTASQQTPRQRSQAGESSGASGGVSTAIGYVRRAASSGLLAGFSGGMNLLRARRALDDGDTGKAARYGVTAAFWLGVASMQWQSKRGGGSGRSGDVDQRDVVDTAPDVEDVSSGSRPTGSGDGTPIEVNEATPAPDVESDASTTEVNQTDVVDIEPDLADVEGEGGGEDVQDADGVEKADDAAGVEGASDAEGMESVDEATGVTDVEDADGTSDLSNGGAAGETEDSDE